MRRAVRVIIIHDNKLLVMHRNKFGEEYDTLPGGRVELGESLEQALYREVAEETMVRFDQPRLVFVEHAGDPYGDQYVYVCNFVAGQPRLHPESEESHINKLGQNLYIPSWIPLTELAKRPFRSEKLKQHILDGLEMGWPTKVMEIAG